MAPNVAWETCDIKDVGFGGFIKATTPKSLVEKSIKFFWELMLN
jgi:hypothetical protein